MALTTCLAKIHHATLDNLNETLKEIAYGDAQVVQREDVSIHGSLTLT